ncbi:MAG TPA: alpha/beta fold hydrolase [Candidatus Sulfotelmatobacter sp.]|nr:alpha/beta fold hydrolase [Candidatus Sulfotelmatobacter sp.]
MNLSRCTRRLLLAFLIYLAACSLSGVYVADGTLHPGRRLLTNEETAAVRSSVRKLNANLADLSITTPDGVPLSAWLIQPQYTNGSAVIVLHGLGDNRLGMTGYAKLFLDHGFSVLLPDARGHGISGGSLVTYGLLERNDVHEWINVLQAQVHPQCIFGLGESMGAAELLQSLATHPDFCAVAAESPFSDFREIAYDRMGQAFHTGPWLGRTLLRPVVEVAFLRVRWKYGLDMQMVSPEQSIADSKIPVLLIHGQVDSNIPVRHSRMIHTQDPHTVLWEVPNAGHCGALSVAPKEFEEKMLDWFSTKPQNVAKQNVTR